jgi:lysophospholipase L1-like esterase
MLGDSVTMGHGVTRDETFANQLETLINADSAMPNSQIINTGVQGYATHQELVTFRRSLKFKPDFVAVCFVMNDVTEPFLVDRRLGGDGIDYHGVEQFSTAVIGYLWNETGLGRLAQVIWAGGGDLQEAQREEIFNVHYMAANADDERIQNAWHKALEDLDAIAALAEQEDIPLLLMVFPFTFQFLNDDLQNPQDRLLDHASMQGVPVIDFTSIFEDLIFGPENVEDVKRAKLNPGDIQEKYRAQIDRYFLDSDHLTEEGHAVVARILLAHMTEAKLLSYRP